MLVIRLTRIGKKNQPSFRLVVVDKRVSASAGKSVEILGTYNPLTKGKTFKKERILYWISKGAQPSASVNNLLVTEKIIEGKKVASHNKKKGGEAPAPVAAPAAPAAPEAPVAPATPATPA